MGYIPLIISLLVTQISPSVIIIIESRRKIPICQRAQQLSYIREACAFHAYKELRQWFLYCHTIAVISFFVWEVASDFPGFLWAEYHISQVREYIKIREQLLSACIWHSCEDWQCSLSHNQFLFHLDWRKCMT